jgi:capsular polysaccharide transport system permease protein
MAGAVSNSAIMIYPQIKVLDILVARSILEGAISTVVSCILLGIMSFFKLGDLPANPLGFLAAIWIGVFVGFSLGSTLSVMNQFSRETETIFKPFLRILIFVSGIFYLSDDLPVHLRSIAEYSPIFHIVQYSREGYFDNIRVHSDLIFVFLFALPFLFFGLLVERAASRRSTLD